MIASTVTEHEADIKVAEKAKTKAVKRTVVKAVADKTTAEKKAADRKAAAEMAIRSADASEKAARSRRERGPCRPQHDRPRGRTQGPPYRDPGLVRLDRAGQALGYHPAKHREPPPGARSELVGPKRNLGSEILNRCRPTCRSSSCSPGSLRSSAWLPGQARLQEGAAEGIYEAVLLDRGVVLPSRPRPAKPADRPVVCPDGDQDRLRPQGVDRAGIGTRCRPAAPGPGRGPRRAGVDNGAGDTTGHRHARNRPGSRDDGHAA